MHTHHHFTQTVNGETLAATITRPANQPETMPTILFLHGAGPGGKHRYDVLAEELARHGYTSLRFDQSGHGESTGQLNQSSLTKRLEEILAFTPLLNHATPLTVMGSSMGGHLACRLLEHLPVATLIAQVPAAYTASAENLTFDDTFTAALKQPESWNNALIWQQLEKFNGNFLLITAGYDPIIPLPIIRKYWNHSRNTLRRTHLYLPEAEHSLAPWLNKNPLWLVSYVQAIRSVLPHA